VTHHLNVRSGYELRWKQTVKGLDEGLTKFEVVGSNGSDVVQNCNFDMAILWYEFRVLILNVAVCRCHPRSLCVVIGYLFRCMSYSLHIDVVLAVASQSDTAFSFDAGTVSIEQHE